MFEPRIRVAPVAFLVLICGSVGDWVSTRFGLSIGLIEGNPIALELMASGSWIQVDMVMVLICILIPLIVSRFIDSRKGKLLLGFPLVAGLMKIGVAAWNLSLILA